MTACIEITKAVDAWKEFLSRLESEMKLIKKNKAETLVQVHEFYVKQYAGFGVLGYDFVMVHGTRSKSSFFDFKIGANQIILVGENEWNSFPTYLS